VDAYILAKEHSTSLINSDRFLPCLELLVDVLEQQGGPEDLAKAEELRKDTEESKAGVEVMYAAALEEARQEEREKKMQKAGKKKSSKKRGRKRAKRKQPRNKEGGKALDDSGGKRKEEGAQLSLESSILDEEKKTGQQKDEEEEEEEWSARFASARWRRKTKTTWSAGCSARTSFTGAAWRAGPALAPARDCCLHARLAAGLWC